MVDGSQATVPGDFRVYLTQVGGTGFQDEVMLSVQAKPHSNPNATPGRIESCDAAGGTNLLIGDPLSSLVARTPTPRGLSSAARPPARSRRTSCGCICSFSTTAPCRRTGRRQRSAWRSRTETKPDVAHPEFPAAPGACPLVTFPARAGGSGETRKGDPPSLSVPSSREIPFSLFHHPGRGWRQLRQRYSPACHIPY